MNEQKSLEQLVSIYGFKILRFLKSKHLTDKEIYHIIEQLHMGMQYQKWRDHFREHPKEIFDI